MLGAELLGLAPGHCAVNVPADAPRLDEADLVLTTLENLLVERLPDGNVNVSLKD